MSEIVELIILVTIFGFIGILFIYAWQSVVDVINAIKPLVAIKDEFIKLGLRFDGLYAIYVTIKDDLEKIGNLGDELKVAFSNIMVVFDILKQILGPVCAATKFTRTAGSTIINTLSAGLINM